MKFFKAEDFNDEHMQSPLCSTCSVDAADLANAKLEREGRKIEGRLTPIGNQYGPQGDVFELVDKPFVTHKALLINIEEINKCEHPKEKIEHYVASRPTPNSKIYCKEYGFYKCECGAKVKPTSFEEVK